MPPPPKLRYQSDVNWDSALKGYRCRVLLQPSQRGGFEAHPRDLIGVESGYGATDREAMNQVKANLTKKLTELHGDKIPWVEIHYQQEIGARVVKVLIEPDTSDVIGAEPEPEAPHPATKTAQSVPAA